MKTTGPKLKAVWESLRPPRRWPYATGPPGRCQSGLA
jgi:hypothetical protein